MLVGVTRGGLDIPASFTPREPGARAVEPTDARPRISVDELVEGIAKEYRDLQRKKGKVDNWGQPKVRLDEEQLRRDLTRSLAGQVQESKSPSESELGRRNASPAAESLSEAIGRRFTERYRRDYSGETLPRHEERGSLSVT